MFAYLLIVYDLKSVNENYWCSSSAACQEKKTDWTPRLFSFDKSQMIKVHYISPQFWHFSFSEAQNDQGVTQLVIKPFDIFLASKIVG